MERINRLTTTKAIAAFAMAIALMLLMTMGAGQAHASTLAGGKGTVAISYEKGSSQVILKSSCSNAKPLAVKLSNKSVARVSVSGGQIVVTAKKPGTTTLKYRWNKKNHTVKIKVYKYQNPLKSLTIGGKQYKSKFAKHSVVALGSKIPSGTVRVTGAKNWKVKEISYGYDVSIRLKNGSKLPKRSMGFLWVTVYNTHTKVTEDLSLGWAKW